MKVASIRTARSIWLVRLIDINPRGKFILPAVIGLMERYKFAKAPDHAAVIATPTKIPFETGSFPSADGSPIYVDLTVHDDGLVADTRSSTEDADRFLHDVLTWLSGEFHLPPYADLGVKRIYSSEVSVFFEKPLAVFNDRFSRFASKLTLNSLDGTARELGLTHVNFGSDPAAGNTVSLRIEREAGTPFAEQRYYSSANTKTADHLQLLQEFEKAATG